MAVSRIYWGCALREPLQSAYHRIRSLKLRETHVGWDMFIVRVNLSIRRHVSHHVSCEHPAEFLKYYLSPTLWTTQSVNCSIGPANRKR
eukprot:4338915-Pleurochrysis_carterae.AAC.1